MLNPLHYILPPHKSNSHNDTGELGAQGILNHYFPQAQTGGN